MLPLLSVLPVCSAMPVHSAPCVLTRSSSDLLCVTLHSLCPFSLSWPPPHLPAVSATWNVKIPICVPGACKHHCSVSETLKIISALVKKEGSQSSFMSGAMLRITDKMEAPPTHSPSHRHRPGMKELGLVILTFFFFLSLAELT